MTLRCEVETNLRAESRFSQDDITRFGDSNDRAAIAQFSSRVCSYFDNYVQRHGKAGRMRIKGDPRPGSGYSLGLWTIERDGSIRKDHERQVAMEIVSPIMAYDMTELWSNAVNSMYRSVEDRYSFEANANDRSVIICNVFTMGNSLKQNPGKLWTTRSSESLHLLVHGGPLGALSKAIV